MRKYKIVLDKTQQFMLKQILADLLDKNNKFKLLNVAEHAYAIAESEKLMRQMWAIPDVKTYHFQFYQLVLMYQIIDSYPVNTQNIDAIRYLIAPFHKHYLTVKQLLDF